MVQSLIYISFCSTFLPVAFAIFSLSKQPRDLKSLSIFFILTAVIEVAEFILGKSNFNLWLVNLFALVEGLFFMFLLRYWSASKTFKNLTLVLSIAYLGFWLSTTLIASLFTFNEYEKTVKGVILIFGTSFVLIEVGLNSTHKLYSEFRFWMLIGILFYFSLTLVIFATSKVLFSNEEGMKITWPIHAIVNTVSNIIFSIGYLCFYRKKNFSL